ncbi:minor capsid protein [Jeotgalibacillus malaysiensis]|uniref:minor capsid protein n=1 Tax=Jeotgalibacillus malaysiensis TaxID=1508404 RepID=UPI00384ECDEE
MLEAITQLIEDQLTDYIIAENLYINHYPDDPDNVVTVIGGRSSNTNRYLKQRERVIEFKVRNKNYREGYEICNSIIDLFDEKEHYILGDTYIINSYILYDTTYLYADSKSRDEFTFELAFLIQK